MLRRTIAVAGLLLVLCGCRDAAAPAHVARWRDDLAFLERELPARHLNLYARLPEAEWHAGFATLRAELPRLTDAQILVRAMALVVAVGDGHTRLAEPPGGGFAVKLAWFDDGLFVIGAVPAAAWAIGGEVTAIGAGSVDDALALAGTVAPHDNDSQRKLETVAALSRPRTAEGLGLVGADRALRLAVAVGAAAPRELVVTPLDGRPTGRPRGGAAPPLAQRASGRIYWSEYLADRDALFVQYNQCKDGTPRFADFTAQLAATLAAHPTARLIIDLRWNGGGNSEVARPLVTLLETTPSLAARTFVLIGRQTFSSAVLNALAFADAGATLVGETAGGAPSHFGEVQTGLLPRTGFPFTYSTKFFPHPRYPGRELVPTLVAPFTAADYFADRDAALDVALAAPLPAP